MRKGKLVTTLCVFMTLAGLAVAETDYVAMPVIKNIQNGANTRDQIKTLRVQGSGTIGGALDVAGATTSDEFVGGGAGITGLTPAAMLLPTAQIYVGSATSQAVAKAVSGGGTIDTNGVLTLVETDAAALAAIFDDFAVTATPGTSPTNVVEVVLKDAAGDTLTDDRSFWMWFTTAAVQTRPTTNEIASVSIIAGGFDVLLYPVDASTNTYGWWLATTDTNGVWRATVVGASADTTNILNCLSGNGKLVKTSVVFP